MEKKNILTVVICTRNRARLFEYCIRSLIEQKVNDKSFSLIVVDNNSSDDTVKMFDKYKSSFIDAKYIVENNIGLSYARNAAIKQCTTDWIGFIDDDAIASSDWIQVIFEIIKNYKYDIFGGIYLPWYLDGRVSWYKDEYASNTAWIKHKEIVLLEKDELSGGNCVFKKTVFNKYLFNIALGHRGNGIGYGEETEIQNKLRNEGARIGFVPNMVIYHYVPLYKQKMSYFYMKSYARGRDSWDASLEKIRIENLLELIFLLPAKVINRVIKNVIYMLRRNERIENCIVNVLDTIAYDIGKIYCGIKRVKISRASLRGRRGAN
jgi:glucosyl-dolichyl phosphate glucuronosyltransferase